MTLLLLICLFGDPPSTVGLQHLQSLENGTYKIQHAHEDSSYTFIGQPLTLTSSGLIFQNSQDQRLLYYQWNGNKTTELPPLQQGTLQSIQLPYLHQTAVMTYRHLMLLSKAHWVPLELPIWYEYTEPKNNSDSTYGIRPIPPHIFNRNETSIWIYQDKDGSLHRYTSDGTHLGKKTIPTKMVPIMVGKNLLWINAPKKGYLGLNHNSNDFGLATSRSIDNLTRHSPFILTKGGIWLLTFSDGFSDALDAWQEGKVPVTANYVEITGGRIKVSSHNLGRIPVTFQLTTSNSGSPRLEVDPTFTALSISGTNLLALCRDGHMRTLDPSGSYQEHKLTMPPSELWAIISQPEGFLLRTHHHSILISGGSP